MGPGNIRLPSRDSAGNPDSHPRPAPQDDGQDVRTSDQQTAFGHQKEGLNEMRGLISIGKQVGWSLAVLAFLCVTAQMHRMIASLIGIGYCDGILYDILGFSVTGIMLLIVFLLHDLYARSRSNEKDGLEGAHLAEHRCGER
jgi:hypothetical protein